MAHLTNGTMSYERRVKTGDFEHKHAVITINYALDEGDDADQLLALTRTLVVQHVHAALRGSPPPVPAVDPRNPPPVQPPSPSPLQPEIDDGGCVEVHSGNGAAPVVAVVNGPDPDPVVGPGNSVTNDELNRGFMVPGSFTKSDAELLPRTTLKEALAEIVTPVTNLKAAKRAAKKRGPIEEHVIEDPTLAPGPQQSLNGAGSNAPIVDGGNVIEDDFTAVAPAATDAELAQALSRVNAVLKDRPRIQALIGEFVQSGQHYYMIPAVRRAEFVSKLEALV